MKMLKKIIPIAMLFLICFFTISCGGKKTSNSTLSNSNIAVSQDINHKDKVAAEDNKLTKNNELTKDNNEANTKNHKDELKDSNASNKTEKNSDDVKTKENNSNSNANKKDIKSNKSIENKLNTEKSEPNSKKVELDKSVPKEDKKKKDSFTLIIAKESKGYTGKEPEILVEKDVEISEDKNAMTYLRENSDIRDKGGFIYEINEIRSIYPIPASKKTDEQKKLGVLGVDWFIYLNGEKTSVGANDVYLNPGDELLLDYHEWDKREFSSETQ
ncbi:DUF4430 domain-containing protein [Clostridium sp. MSJ-11]|uniref:DUF4430 domain-containing protein n=1 Tax=Clostridium mobile TaxID=2841512 RepID=A0ABS6EK76_9CLOT|nr:DUF4430 domain-containing protein [Clostridium mobile]MBU5485609.1 DUF4430 domain-containing protein [Clostridium mobile]